MAPREALVGFDHADKAFGSGTGVRSLISIWKASLNSRSLPCSETVAAYVLAATTPENDGDSSSLPPAAPAAPAAPTPHRPCSTKA